jgi:hypothetical protein
MRDGYMIINKKEQEYNLNKLRDKLLVKLDEHEDDNLLARLEDVERKLGELEND